MKDDAECECMNEMFNSSEEMPPYHWRPVALYYEDDTRIRDLTKEEQIAWIKKQNGRLQ